MTDTACVVCRRDTVDKKKPELVEVAGRRVRLCHECARSRFAYEHAVRLVRGMK